MPNNDLISRADVLDLMQPYGPATYDMPYGSGDIIIRPLDVIALPAVDAVPVVRCKDCCKRNTNYCAIAWTESDPFIGEQVISEFYEPDDPDNWFCADGERADAHTCGTKLDGGELNDT